MERSVNSHRAHRNHATYWAFVLHRVSGVVLALFLPVHFYMLSMSITDAARFDTFIGWTDMPLVKFAEAGLVVLLALHLTGGLRLLALEFLPWRDWQKSAVALGSGLSLIIGLVYLLYGA
jgi:fumarate reductase subunit D